MRNPGYVPFLNPGSNSIQRSLLRLVNPGSSQADVTITGVDDAGDASRQREVRLTLPAGAARMLSARELEQGGFGLAGRLGDGTAKWRLWVSAHRPILVMSLLELPTGHLTNLSRGRTGVSDRPSPPLDGPDLVVEPPVPDFRGHENAHTNIGLTWTSTVRNDGGVASVPTRLRIFRSSDATISTSDTEVATAAVDGIHGSEFRIARTSMVPSSVGTYYYGACVDAVRQELDTANNCSSAVPVEISRGYFRLVLAGGWVSQQQRCRDGVDGVRGWFIWSYDTNDPSRLSEQVESTALSFCRQDGLFECRILASTGDGRAAAGAYGETGSRCELFGGAGATVSAAQRDALSKCRADLPAPSDCSIWARRGIDVGYQTDPIRLGEPSRAVATSTEVDHSRWK